MNNKMAGLIKFSVKNEGEIFNKWLSSRLIRHNKNVISAELGATGSGKSYRDLRKIELWYQYHFKETVPLDNICFGLGAAMARLASGNLRRGEIIILEEAGANLGSRDWQSKVSKMFNYILQSFRSMNVGLFLNLPYLSMLDSQARHLLHYYSESVGIDYEKKTNKCKPFFVEVAQGTGKIYRHYPIVKMNGRSVKVKRFNYAMPSQYLIDDYEKKKEVYIREMIKKFSETVNGKPKVKVASELAWKCYSLNTYDGKSMQKIADEIGKSPQRVFQLIHEVKKWKKIDENKEKEGGVGVIYQQKPPQPIVN